MAKITRCKKALISNLSDLAPICEATVTAIDEDAISIIIDPDFLDELESESRVIFFDELKGLITYDCSLAILEKYYKNNVQVQAMICYLNKEISIEERRDDYKIAVNIDFEVLIPEHVPIPDDFEDYVVDEIDGRCIVKAEAYNLSAGGLFFSSLFHFPSGESLTIYLPIDNNRRSKLTAKILRVEEIDGKYDQKFYGYGCKFENLPQTVETALRSYVFKLQMKNREKLFG